VLLWLNCRWLIVLRLGCRRSGASGHMLLILLRLAVVHAGCAWAGHRLRRAVEDAGSSGASDSNRRQRWTAGTDARWQDDSGAVVHTGGARRGLRDARWCRVVRQTFVGRRQIILDGPCPVEMRMAGRCRLVWRRIGGCARLPRGFSTHQALTECESKPTAGRPAAGNLCCGRSDRACQRQCTGC
jgi:hypothetical protein